MVMILSLAMFSVTVCACGAEQTAPQATDAKSRGALYREIVTGAPDAELVVATVNGIPIYGKEINGLLWANQLNMQEGIETKKLTRNEAVEQCAETIMVFEEARRLGIEMTAAEKSGIKKIQSENDLTDELKEEERVFFEAAGVTREEFIALNCRDAECSYFRGKLMDLFWADLKKGTFKTKDPQVQELMNQAKQLYAYGADRTASTGVYEQTPQEALHEVSIDEYFKSLVRLADLQILEIPKTPEEMGIKQDAAGLYGL